MPTECFHRGDIATTKKPLTTDRTRLTRIRVDGWKCFHLTRNVFQSTESILIQKSSSVSIRAIRGRRSFPPAGAGTWKCREGNWSDRDHCELRSNALNDWDNFSIPTGIPEVSPGSRSNRDDHPGIGIPKNPHPERRAGNAGCTPDLQFPSQFEPGSVVSDRNKVFF